MSRTFHAFVITAIITFFLSSCTSRERVVPLHTMPPTQQAELIFNEKRLPAECLVFAHLIVSIPAQIPARRLTETVEDYAMQHGADYILVGMTRESDDSEDSVTFQSFGPQTPYSFKDRWSGWKFGFSVWNSGGPLVDYGRNRITGETAAFTGPVMAQAALLSCQP